MRPRAGNLACHAGTFSTVAGNSCRGFVACAISGPPMSMCPAAPGALGAAAAGSVARVQQKGLSARIDTFKKDLD